MKANSLSGNERNTESQAEDILDSGNEAPHTSEEKVAVPMTSRNPLEELGRSWGLLGAEDPLWAILSDPAKRGGGWDIDDFLATGKQEVEEVFTYLREISLPVERRRAMDFGCGVGRVTHSLAKYFDFVVGVDVSPAMIDRAIAIHSGFSNLSFQHSAERELPFPDESFDFVYSRLVLQHMASNLALQYVSEFVRVLRIGGVAVFQAPSRCRVGDGVGPSEIQLSSGCAFIEMHAHPPEYIEQAVTASGGKIADLRDDPCAGEAFDSLKYAVLRES